LKKLDLNKTESNLGKGVNSAINASNAIRIPLVMKTLPIPFQSVANPCFRWIRIMNGMTVIGVK